MAPTAPVFLSHPSSLEHDPGPHPEQPARIKAIERELALRPALELTRIESRATTRAALERVHTARHIDTIEAIAARGGGQIDLDTAMSEGSLNAALHAAGGAQLLAELLVSGEASSGFSAHRPPGHHAPAAQAMGFCLFNNVAVAAAHALAELGCERVMIVDYDVHHGNGTSDIFHASRDVLFCSIHQSPLYPGSGPAGDVGSGAGEGFTVNLPVPGGAGDREFLSLIDGVIGPLAERFSPQLILASAGFDAHAADPLAGCTMSDDGYAAVAGLLRGTAERLEVPLGFVLEGGYDLGALGRSVARTLEVLAAPAVSVVGAQPTPLSRAALERLERYFPGISAAV